MRRCLTRRDENGGENASGFREGANSSQARRFAKRRRISSLLGCPRAGNNGYENRGNGSGFREGANSSQARRFAKRRRISSLARFAANTRFGIFEGVVFFRLCGHFRESRVMRRCLTRRDENGGENASGFREGANSSQARRFAKRRRISSLARFAADTRFGIFEGGTVCGGHAARDFREGRLISQKAAKSIACHRFASRNIEGAAGVQVTCSARFDRRPEPP